LAAKIQGLPWGSGSGMAVERADGADLTSYVFCIRVGDWDRPVFRYVEMGTGEPTVVDDTLACLDHARPANGFDTPRVLDEDTYTLAFDAWAIARDDVIERWNWHADKANLEPKVPKVLARAAEIVRSHAPRDADQDAIDRAVDTLQAPYPERILRTFRAALGVTDDPTEQATHVLRIIAELGLQPYEAPEPLPEITD
ncbi:MAG: hypothetical protein KDA95_12540, partial [Acidimicrobiales bacterium]|nr:hypothetical protein [Acidimicrobiales bacterium]